jgi:hypothetical protein
MRLTPGADVPAEKREEQEDKARAVFVHQELKKTSWGEEGDCV